MLRVLLQLESPKSEHQNSSYVLNNPDYSMFKNRTRNWLEHGPTLSEFLGHIESEFEGTYFQDFWFSLKSILISHLNHSNRIINERVMAKLRTLVKTEHGVPIQVSTGSVLESCTGTGLRCTGTGHRKMPRMCVFLPFFHMLIPKSTQYSINTSKPLQIHLIISILLNSSFITYLSSKLFHEFLPKPF